MKNRVLVISLGVICFLCFSCKNNSTVLPVRQESHTIDGVTTIQFDTTSHHFGKLAQGEVVSYTFRFQNTGTTPLLIKDVKAGCGCTVPEWPQEPVAPGKKEGIEVTFDASGRSGNQYKTIKVFANTHEAEHQLVITAEIERNF